MSFVGPYKRTIDYGDTVIVHIGYQNQKALVVTPNGTYQNVYGIFSHDTLIGKPFGCKWTATRPAKKPDNANGTARDNALPFVLILHPTADLWTQVLSHRTQIIYSMDASFIVMALNLKPGSLVIESGTGSGSLSHHFLKAIAPGGHLYTFEFHEKRFEEAVTEFKQHGLYPQHASVFHQDVYQDGFSNVAHKVDAVFLDLPNPWKAVHHAKKALKKNQLSRICTFSPCIEQVQHTIQELTNQNFMDIYMVEVLDRCYSLKKSASHLEKEKFGALSIPEGEMQTHTSYLLFASLPPCHDENDNAASS